MDDGIIGKTNKYTCIIIIIISVIIITLNCTYFTIQILLNLENQEISKMSLIKFILYSTDILIPQINLGRLQYPGILLLMILPDIFVPLHWYSIYIVLKNKYKIKNIKAYTLLILLVWLSFTLIIWLFAWWNTFSLWALSHAKYPG